MVGIDADMTLRVFSDSTAVMTDATDTECRSETNAFEYSGSGENPHSRLRKIDARRSATQKFHARRLGLEPTNIGALARVTAH